MYVELAELISVHPINLNGMGGGRKGTSDVSTVSVLSVIPISLPIAIEYQLAVPHHKTTHGFLKNFFGYCLFFNCILHGHFEVPSYL